MSGFPGCGCYRDHVEERDVIAALHGFRFRCISCGSADRVGIHGMIPTNTVEQDLAVALCADCHFKVGAGKLDLRMNRRAQEVLKKWEANYPESRTDQPDYFPEDYLP